MLAHVAEEEEATPGDAWRDLAAGQRRSLAVLYDVYAERHTGRCYKAYASSVSNWRPLIHIQPSP